MTDANKTIAESPNPADERRAQLAALLPDAFSEGKLDVAALKRALGRVNNHCNHNTIHRHVTIAAKCLASFS